MRFLSLVGLYQAGSSDTMRSGISYTAQGDIALGSLAVEKYAISGGVSYENIYEYVRISGTCTVGSLLFYTGTALGYVHNSGTSQLPAGIAMVSPTASGVYSWMLKQGVYDKIQITATVAGSGLTSLLYGGIGSAAGNISNAAAFVSAAGNPQLALIGRALTDATGSTCVGFVGLL